MANGPDGSLYVIDMYRELIEGAAFLPPAHPEAPGRRQRLRQGTDLPHRARGLPAAEAAAAGQGLDRRAGGAAGAPQRLAPRHGVALALPAAGPVGGGAAAGSWPPRSKSPLGRMHALYALDGLKALDVATVLRRLHDPEPRVREHALRLAEPFAGRAPEIRARLDEMTDDPDLRVRYQLAFSLGAVPGRDAEPGARRRWPAATATTPGSGWRSSARSTAGPARCSGCWPATRISAPPPHGRAFLAHAGGAQSAAPNRPDEIAAVLDPGIRRTARGDRALARDIVSAAWCAEAAAGRRGPARRSRRAARPAPSSPTCSATPGRPPPTRRRPWPTASRRSAARPGAFADQTQDLLAGSARRSASRSRCRPPPWRRWPASTSRASPALLLEAWPGLSPQLRAGGHRGALRPAGLDRGLPRRGRDRARSTAATWTRPACTCSRTIPTPSLRARAAKLFAATKLARRQDVVAAYQKALQLKGDRARGKAVFKKECSACHQLEGVGHADRRRPERHPRPRPGGGPAQHPRPQPRGQAAVPQLRPGDRRPAASSRA